MSDKSYVTLEQHVCVVCAKPFDTNALLLHRRLAPVFERHTVTGWGLCPEHQKLKDDGFVALVEIDRAKSSGDSPEEVFRLGRICHIKKSAWPFESEPPEKGVGWADAHLLDLLEQKAAEAK